MQGRVCHTCVGVYVVADEEARNATLHKHSNS